MNLRQPVLFVGHGSPMTMITDNPEKTALAALGAVLPRPRAVLCISAHWETQGRTHLTAAGNPRTVHDFRGFPQALFDWHYDAQSPEWLVERVAGLIGEDRVLRDDGWGYDHGTWGVMDLLFPGEHLPTTAMSLNRSLDADAHLALGAALAPLRDEGVMIIASGNVVHNLALYRQTIGTQPEWADAFRHRVNAAVEEADLNALTRFAPDDAAAGTAINSAEHYIPLLYAMGARLPGDEVGIFNDRVDGALSMTSYLIGDPAPLSVLQ